MASTDSFFGMISFFVIALVVVIFAVIWSNFASIDVLWSQVDVGSSIKTDVQSYVDHWDFILVCMYFGIHMMILGLALLLRTHPVMYISAILFTILLIVIAAPLANNWDELIDGDAFSVIKADFSMTNHVMSKLPFYELVWAILTMIVLFGFARSEGIL